MECKYNWQIWKDIETYEQKLELEVTTCSWCDLKDDNV